jgi:ABC-type sugar transport system ATPase subunit
MNLVPGSLVVVDGQVRFEGAGLSLDLDGYPFGHAPRPGQVVKLGVRPEHLSLCLPGRSGETANGVARLGRATTVVSEPLGSLSVVWIEAGGQRLGAQVAGGAEPPNGSEVEVVVTEAGRASVFDAETERRL